MQIPKQWKNFFTSSYFFLFGVSFALWCIAFRGFLSGETAFINDAITYLNQTKRLTDGFLQGALIMWNPESFGMPNDFFLLRLGAYNPLYLVITALRACGIPFLLSYAWVMAGYYFLGCVGFYLFCVRITHHRLASFIAYLLLYFSTLGTRIFDSFIILIFVPFAWFCFFLISFTEQPSRRNFLGLVFTTMILLSTYVPFYFVIMVMVALVLFFVLFPRKFFHVLRTVFSFVKKEKILSCVGIFAVIVAMIPGMLFMTSSAKGRYIMPNRHRDVSTNHAVEVSFDVTKEWAVLEDVLFSAEFKDLREIKFAVLYFPALAWILIVLGMVTRIYKKQILLILFMIFFFILGIPQELPLYRFFRENVLIFKYFRNLHFFLWWGILPALFLLLTEQLKNFLKEASPDSKYFKVRLGFIILLHLGLGIFFFLQEGVLASTILAIILSLFFFILYSFKKEKTSFLVGALALCAVVVQPMEVYYHLNCNSEPWTNTKFYDAPIQSEFIYIRNQLNSMSQEATKINFYIALQDVVALEDHLNLPDFLRYVDAAFTVYDHVEVAPQEQFNWNELKWAMANGINLVFLDSFDESKPLLEKQKKALVVTDRGQGIDVSVYKPNRISFQTDFQEPKVVVWNDAFHAGWSGKIDGEPLQIYRANAAFKGMYVPAGSHQVTLLFNDKLPMRYGFWLIFLSIFSALCWYCYKDYRYEV